MASRKVHCEECLEKLGNEFEEVHKWLDGLACIKPGYLNLNHRRYRHHIEGIAEVRRMFGDKAAEAAVLHITKDFGRVPTRQEVEDEFPDEPEFMKFSNFK